MSVLSGVRRTGGEHGDREHLALKAFPEPQTELRPDKVVFVVNLFDELRRIAPAGQR